MKKHCYTNCKNILLSQYYTSANKLKQLNRIVFFQFISVKNKLIPYNNDVMNRTEKRNPIKMRDECGPRSQFISGSCGVLSGTFQWTHVCSELWRSTGVCVCVCVSLGQHAGHTLFKVERSFRTDVTHTPYLYTQVMTPKMCAVLCVP